MKKSLVLLAFCAIFFSSCNESKSQSYKIPANDKGYFLGLRSASKGELGEARRLFVQSAKKGSAYVARRSAEKLTEIGNQRERLSSADSLIKTYNDENALLMAVKQYNAAEDYTKIILHTASINLAEAENQLVYYRLCALKKKESAKFYDFFYTWATERAFSSWHAKLFSEVLTEQDFTEKENIFPVIKFRYEVFNRKYAAVFENLSELQEKLPLIPQIVSDLGKVYLYGSSSYYKNALSMTALAKKTTGTEAEFFAWFYAGRNYAKLSDYTTSATQCYKSAMQVSNTDRQFDNALWYLLDLHLSRSTSQGIKMILQYCSQWHDGEYFEDLFDKLSPILLSEDRWNDFYTIYKAIDGFATDDITAKYAYIYGRLVQEKLVLPSIEDTHNSEDIAAFSRALISGSSDYYRIMAVSRLKIAGAYEEEAMCSAPQNTNFVPDELAENLLLGYVSSGLVEYIYPEWQRLFTEGKFLGLEKGKRIVKFLYDCGKTKYEYNPQGLRIAVRIAKNSRTPIQKEDLKLLFPKCYADLVEEKCKEYEIPPEIMYALIRSESFFDANISSVAGAIGLTQLMKPTGEDIARRLKFSEYDLKNPNDNIEFGTYYIQNLYGRLENQWLPAFFAYNAGITRVRRWIKSSSVEFNNPKSLPMDLFLETIPFTETREYGRKLVSAFSMYEWLYNETDIQDAVETVIR